MLALDLSGLSSGSVSWHSVASIPIRDPLSSEGISLALLPAPAPLSGGGALPGADSSPLEYVLLSFGGYNGKYQNAVSVIKVRDFIPQKQKLLAPKSSGTEGEPTLLEAAEAPSRSGSASAAPAAAAAGSKKQPAPAAAAKPPAKSDAQLVPELRTQLEGARRDAEAALREAASAKEGAGHELALLRSDLNKAHTALAEASKGWEGAKQGLARERERVMKLEAEVAELNKRLGAAAELQKEVEALRRYVKEAEAKKGSAGVWGYLSGQ